MSNSGELWKDAAEMILAAGAAFVLSIALLVCAIGIICRSLFVWAKPKAT